MSGSIVRRLILKDLYLFRWMIAGSIVAGGISVLAMPLGRISAYVGGVSLICVLVILNIFLVLQGVVQERKDKVLLFLLSLPVSTTQHTVAKVAANVTAFFGPWLILTAANMAVIDATPIPNGILPFWLAVLGYLLSYYCVLLAVALVRPSVGWHSTSIVVGNVSVNFLIPFLLSRPSVSGNAGSPTAVWTEDIVFLLVAELVVAIAALGLALYVHSRRRDYV